MGHESAPSVITALVVCGTLNCTTPATVGQEQGSSSHEYQQGCDQGCASSVSGEMQHVCIQVLRFGPATSAWHQQGRCTMMND